MTTPLTVAVVGGGASGCLTAMHVARAAAGRHVEIVILEPGVVGAGLAYSTPDPRHRLNVPAKGMSAYPEDPEHFLRWLRRQVDVDFPADGFAPRSHYADYLAQTLSEAVAAGASVHLEKVPARVTDLRRHGRRLRLTLDDGTGRAVDAVVLATGHGAPSIAWAPEALRRSARFVADPWRADTVAEIPAGSDVLLVGAGLTMADMALTWGRAGVRLHVASRHGMLPLPHATTPASPAAAPQVPDGQALTLAEVRRLVFAQLRSAGGDWRPVIDGMRPVTAILWSRMSSEARQKFLATAARRWDRVRHRIDPALHAWLAARQADGSLIVHAAAVAAACEEERGLHVRLDDGTSLSVAAVVNCTGTCTGLRADSDPLVLNLLDSGTALPGPLDLGFATDAAGRLLPASGPQPAVWTVGPLRRGQLWESTAIPEIRQQAADVARELGAALPRAGLRRRPRDPYDLLRGSGGTLGAGALDPARPAGTPPVAARRPALPAADPRGSA
jgi:uncharacterized NAD(P)/FAD-binding protein YdhS